MSALPVVTAPRALRTPAVAETVLDSGLRVLAVRKAGVPLAELRLRIPLPCAGAALGERQDAVLTVLTETLLEGTGARPGPRVVEDLRGVGGAMAASADADALVISASGLSAGLAALLDVLADVLTEAAHPKAAVRAAKERISQELTIARTVPGLVARTAIARRAHGEHPYARGLTTVEQIDALSAGAVRKAHAGCVRPRGALLVIVSDRPAAGVLRLVEKALAGWTGGKKVHPAPPLPAPAPGPAWLVHRPGAVQSNLRLAGPGLPRQSVDYPALRLAVMVYGGYFSSRLVANIREDKGWTYSPGSALSVRPAGTTISVAAEVATAVSAAALWETVHELGRMATVAVDLAELDAARQYVLGTTALSLASQAGLASAVLTMAAAGLDLAWLKEHQAQLLRVTAEDVLRVSQAHLGPAHLTAAIVGDAEVVSAPLSAVMSIVPASVEA